MKYRLVQWTYMHGVGDVSREGPMMDLPGGAKNILQGGAKEDKFLLTTRNKENNSFLQKKW